MSAAYTPADFPHSPLLVFYETTRACNLLCKHCRATAQKHRHPLELTEFQALSLITQLTTFPRPPLLVLTGGDPVKRPDLFDMIRHANEVGLDVALTPSATPLVTTDVVQRLRSAGLHRMAVSLDGPDAETHDAFRGVPGSFDRTLRIIADARAVGLPVQVNTTLSRYNFHQIDAITDLLAEQKIVLWSVFFLIPTGRATPDQRLSAQEIEHAFSRLLHHSRTQPYAIKTTEAPHYRRYLAQHLPPTAPPPRWMGTNDGRGVMFVSHTGEIYPSGFLPQLCGRFPVDSVVDTYQRHSLFQSLRDAEQLRGKCGQCEYRELCGGSRARAFAMTGDPLGAEPDCAYVPPGVPKELEPCSA
jgi:radical SAM protein with 4Fe4S-binding SPASM domain